MDLGKKSNLNKNNIDFDENIRASNYFSILSKYSSQINWLILTILVLSGINIFLTYSWHFSNLDSAIELRNIYTQSKNISKLVKNNLNSNEIMSYRRELIENLKQSDFYMRKILHEVEYKYRFVDLTNNNDDFNDFINSINYNSDLYLNIIEKENLIYNKQKKEEKNKENSVENNSQEKSITTNSSNNIHLLEKNIKKIEVDIKNLTSFDSCINDIFQKQFQIYNKILKVRKTEDKSSIDTFYLNNLLENFKKVNILDNNSKEIAFKYYTDKVNLKIKSDLDNLKKLQSETQINSLSFLANIKSTTPDYIVVISTLGTVFVFWLYIVLESTRDTLKIIFNDTKLYIKPEIESVFSIFFMILPSYPNRKAFNTLKLTLIFFNISLLGLIISNIHGIFYSPFLCGLSRYQLINLLDSGRILLFYYLIPTILIIFSSIFSFYFSVKQIYPIIDIRNLIFLLRWTRVALKPQIIILLDNIDQDGNNISKETINKSKIKKYIDYENIFIEYRNYKKVEKPILFLSRILGNKYRNYFVIRLNKTKNNEAIKIKGEIDLLGSYQEFYSEKRDEDITSISDLYLKDKLLNRVLTIEEAKMRLFFSDFLRDLISDSINNAANLSEKINFSDNKFILNDDN